MKVRRDHDAELCASRDVDVWIDAPLTDQAQSGQAFEQWSLNPGAPSEQHERFGFTEPIRQGIQVLNVVVPDRDFMAVQLLEALQGPERIVMVIQDRDLHCCSPLFPHTG
jgi:hypothetical protein